MQRARADLLLGGAAYRDGAHAGTEGHAPPPLAFLDVLCRRVGAGCDDSPREDLGEAEHSAVPYLEAEGGLPWYHQRRSV